jgi:hypothetical protein
LLFFFLVSNSLRSLWLLNQIFTYPILITDRDQWLTMACNVCSESSAGHSWGLYPTYIDTYWVISFKNYILVIVSCPVALSVAINSRRLFTGYSQTYE